MKRYLIILNLLILSGITYSQTTYPISQYNGQTVTTCSGIFYDSGGGGGTYSSNESYTITICPEDSGTSISFNFTIWDVGAGATLAMHDGPSTSSWLGATFSDGGFSPIGMGVNATVTNSSGCLTFVWASGSSTGAGWAAEISCVTPCQTVMSGLVSTSPAADDSGYINICPGEEITLIGTGLYPQNNTVYNQANSTSSFLWNFGNGVTDSSSSNITTIVYTEVSGYTINLTVFDTLGCKSTNMLGQRVRISTTPTFGGTHVSEPVICYGDDVDLIGIVNPTMFHLDAGLNWADTTFLPDGYASYTSTLTFDVFSSGQSITNINQLIGICAIMEHSFLGDLNITITCPNGTVVTLKQFPGCGGTFLGVPIDIDANLAPGVGWEYCWAPNPTYNNMNVECSNYSTLPSGSYATVTPISALVGCPLNGDWTITVTDSWLSDNGYIFGWGIDFDPSILPADFDYTPEFEDFAWDVNPAFIVDTTQGLDQYTLTIHPDTGSYDFTFTATDTWGCPYDTTVHLLVHPTYIVNFPPDTTLCSDAVLLLDASNNGQNAGAEYVWHNSYSSTSSTNSWWLADKPGTYWVDIPNIVLDCGHEDTITITYNEMGLDLGVDLNNICSSSPVTMNATTALGGYPSVSYLWSNGATTATITAVSSGTYWVTVSRGACNETDSKTVTYVNPLTINLGQDKYLCQGEAIMLDAGFYPSATYHWSVGLNTQSIEITNPGVYMVSVTNGCGTYKDTVYVTSINLPEVSLGNDTAICSGTQILYLDALYTGPDEVTYHWSNSSITPAIVVAAGGTYCVSVTNQCGVETDCIHVQGDIPLIIDLGTDSTICPGYILNSGYPGCSYYWSNGQTTQSVIVSEADNYSVEVTNTCGSYIDDVNLQVIQLTVYLGSDITICPGGSTILDAQNPGCYYQWSTGQNTQTIEVIGAGTYSVAVTNQCQTKFDTVTVNIFDPELNLGNDTSICSGNSLLLDAGHPGSTYQWSDGSVTQTIEAQTAGTYTVTVTHSCGTLADSIQLSINPLPVLDIGPDTVEIEPGESITIDAGSGFVSYHWSTGSNVQTITVNNQGWYYVTVTNGFGCTGKDKIFVTYPDGVSEVSHEEIRIYPNPAKDFLVISSGKTILSGFELFNSLGKLIKSDRINSNKIYLNTTGYSEGMYYVRVITPNGGVTVKPVSIIK